MKSAAIYARVSSDKQREENTIASQTAALVAFAREQQFEVPQEWVFEDDGYSGASLIRPGLERVRDLAAEGLIQAILVYAPDRLSRRYAYQILLIEEFARAGVETLFVRAPRGSTPEDELLVQFQGMIAEYERAQILERSRRGKRHRARQGEVGVLSGAPFGYRRHSPAQASFRASPGNATRARLDLLAALCLGDAEQALGHHRGDHASRFAQVRHHARSRCSDVHGYRAHTRDRRRGNDAQPLHQYLSLGPG
jgi:DNA invertase Pin-like site-specific DNA recombinase